MTRGSKELARTLADVNASIRDAAALHPLERQRPQVWEFMCECGRLGCYEHVMLSLAEYERLRERSVPVLADGHEQSPIVRARELNEEARALRAQALLQIRRALRNLGHRPPP